MSPAAKLLVVHAGALGDVVLTFPALLELQRNSAVIDLVCQAKIGRLAQKLKVVHSWIDIDAAILAPLYALDAGRVAPALEKRLCTYDRIIVFSFGNRLAAGLRRIGADDVVRIAPRPPISLAIHIGRHIRQGLVKTGLLADDPTPAACRWPHRPSLSTGRPDGAAPVVLHPGSGSPTKNWPLEYFVTLASELKTKKIPVRFALGPAESDMTRALEGLNVPNSAVTVRHDLIDMLMTLVTARAFVGNDSGLAHLAAFIGTPTVAVFGPSDPARWAPVGPAVRVVTAAHDCAPCFENKAGDCLDRMCLESISVRQVMAILMGLLSETVI